MTVILLASLCALPRMPVLLIIPSAVDPPVRERARPSQSRCSALRTNDLDRLGLVCWLVPWSMADGMIRLYPRPATHGARCASDHPGAGVPCWRERFYRPSRLRLVFVP